MKFHDVIEVDINILKEDETNPNELTISQEEALGKSIDRFGFVYPICYDSKTNIIADGEHRLKKLKERGIVKIRAIPIDFLDDAERRLFRQTMNKLHGVHDKYKDAQELKMLLDSNKLDDLAGLIAGNKEEYIMLLEKKELIPPQTHEDDFQVPREAKYKVERGEIWQLGNHRLMCGDATVKPDVERLMSGVKADMLMTSPPYWVGKSYERESNEDEVRKFITNSAANMAFAVSKDLSRIIINTSTGRATSLNQEAARLPLLDWWIQALRPYGWLCRHIRIWAKQGGFSTPSISPHTDVVDQNWEYIATWYNTRGIYRGQNRVEQPWAQQGLWYFQGKATEAGHEASFPLEMPLRNIALYSNPESIVLDLFGGAGTTLIACEQTNRICDMMEIDSYYCSIIIERWEQFTGQKGVKLG